MWLNKTSLAFLNRLQVIKNYKNSNLIEYLPEREWKFFM